jgi:hypothetical protein
MNCLLLVRAEAIADLRTTMKQKLRHKRATYWAGYNDGLSSGSSLPSSFERGLRQHTWMSFIHGASDFRIWRDL